MNYIVTLNGCMQLYELSLYIHEWSTNLACVQFAKMWHQSGPPTGGEGRHSNRNKCCRKMGSFSTAVDNDKDPGRSDTKWVKSQFFIEIYV